MRKIIYLFPLAFLVGCFGKGQKSEPTDVITVEDASAETETEGSEEGLSNEESVNEEAMPPKESAIESSLDDGGAEGGLDGLATMDESVSDTVDTAPQAAVETKKEQETKAKPMDQADPEEALKPREEAPKQEAAQVAQNIPSDDPSHAFSGTAFREAGDSDYFEYMVEKGESLGMIAAEIYGESNAWRKIANENVATIENPNKIYPGMVLRIKKDTAKALAFAKAYEAGEERKEVMVGAGDNLSKLAAKFLGSGVYWRQIYHLNETLIGKNPHRLEVGQKLMILKYRGP